jgi:beta-glucosidase
MRGRAIVAGGCLLSLAVFSGGCRGRITFDPGAVAKNRMFAGVPAGFLLGAATSAHQIEGGTRNDWTLWESGRYGDGTPHVAGGASAARAADSWNLWRRDVAALKELGANVYRVGVEWSRLEPEEGAWDRAAAERYREMFAAMRAAGVEPMVTLHHFTLPLWLAGRGGWDDPGATEAFAAFAGRAGAAFGDLVDWWCTINEPNVFVAKGYLAGQWPPGVKDPRRGALIMRSLLIGHALATAALRRLDVKDADGDGAATRVGIAQNFRIFDPATAHPVDAIVAGGADAFYNDSFIDAIASGRIRINIPTVININEPYPDLRGTFDYLGVNYYTREHVVGSLTGPAVYSRSTANPEGRAHSDMGWEIYPEGLYRLLVRYARHGWPLLVTESGIADRQGDVRPDFLRAHIYAADRARAEGVNVIGFIVWSLIDNFEWSHGYRGRFGLYAIDFEGDPTLARRPTAAVALFQEAARALAPVRP